MKPIIIDMLEVLLRKGETVEMISSFHGNTVNVVVRSASRFTSASAHTAGYYFACEFMDEHIDEFQESTEQRTDDELEVMTLKKFGDKWTLF